MGPELRILSTKPSGSTRATFRYSARMRIHMSIFVVFPKRLENLIRFSISRPDDVDALVSKADNRSRRGRICRGATLLSRIALHPSADNLAVQKSAQIIPSVASPTPCQSAKGNIGQA